MKNVILPPKMSNLKPKFTIFDRFWVDVNRDDFEPKLIEIDRVNKIGQFQVEICRFWVEIGRFWVDFESKSSDFGSKLYDILIFVRYLSRRVKDEVFLKINNRMDINNLKSYSTFDSFSRFETRSNWRLLTQIIWKETEIYPRKKI